MNLQIKELLICIGLILSTQVSSKEITLLYKGVHINAEFELAEGKTLSDGIVLMTHGALAHRDMESQEYIRSLLHEYGYNTLAINLSLGLDNRHGMFDCKITHQHKNRDALDEISRWTQWLQAKGVKQITLMGHSRGGAQTALFAAERSSDLISSIILMAPALKANSSHQVYKKRYKLNLSTLLNNAHKAINAGNQKKTFNNIGLMTCRETSATAESIVSYYDELKNLDTLSLLTKVSVNTLVVAAGADKVVLDLDKKISSNTHPKNIKLVVVGGSDHTFRDLNADDAMEFVDEFLQKNKSKL